jgi:DNA repair exonuclease SbcCD ATPase subunit
MLPYELNIKNFYSHSDSTVDFSQFKSALLIGNTEGDYDKSNGSGKSSIFESILWCLFNKSRASMMDDIIAWGENACSVELLFSHRGESYRVFRVRKRSSSTSSVEFEKMHDGEWVNISGSTSGDTNKKIELTIGLDYKTFTNSIYFRQSDISEFAESDPSKKKDILKKIMDISKWDDYEKHAKAKLKEVLFKMDLLKTRMQELSDRNDLLAEEKQNLSGEKNKLKILSSERDSAEKNIDKINKRYLIAKNNLDTDSYDNTVEKIKSIKDLVEKEELKVKRLSEKSREYEKKVGSVFEDIESESLLVKDLVADEGAEDKLSDSNTTLIEKKAEYNSLNEYLSNLEGILISSDKCYSCGQGISDDLHALLVDKHSQKKSDYIAKINSLSKELTKIDRSISSLKLSVKNNKKLLLSKEKMSSLNSELSVNKDRLSEVLSEEAECNSLISKLNSDLKVNDNILNSLKDDDFTALRRSRAKLMSDKKDLIVKIAEGNKLIGVLTEKVNSLSNDADSLKLKKAELDLMLVKAQTLEKLTKMLGKNGIQTILLDAVIENLENKSNEILSFISNEPTSIMLDTQRVGADGVSIIETLDLKVNMNGVSQNFKSLSGGEQFRISLALRIALSEIASSHGGTSLEFLLLDEVNSPLDKNGVDNLFKNVISSLEDRYKILIITHDPSLKEKFLNVIDVTKINGISSIGCSFI